MDIGSNGEDIAVEYLKRKGYQILMRNYREKFGEIDVICRDIDKTLVFIEVKALFIGSVGNDVLSPEDNLSRHKLYKLQRICQFFANENYNLIGDSGWQIDLISVLIGPKGCEIRHYLNIY